MTPILAYLLKVIICSGILYGYYFIALRNKVFHSWNRFYLLASIVVSMFLPLMEPHVLSTTAGESKMINALQVMAGADEYVSEIQATSSISWNAGMLMNMAYLLISLIVMCWLFFGLTKIYKMIRRYPQQKMQEVLFLNTNEPGTPFSYFRYLFWNEEIDPSSPNGQKILEHELVHIREKHSHDKLFVHLVLTIYWANPFFWLIRKELAMVHEFIADQKTVTDTDSFAQMILSASFPQHTSLLTNAYFHSSIKRRITMITKNKNPRFTYISRLLLIPVLFVLLFTFAVKAEKTALSTIAKSSAVVLKKSADTIPFAKKIKSVTATYSDQSNESFTEEEFRKKISFAAHSDTSAGLKKSESVKATITFSQADIASIDVSDKHFTIKTKNNNDSGTLKKVTEMKIHWDEDSPQASSGKMVTGKSINSVDPMYTVDGKEISKAEMESLDVNKIESIHILKGESATALYGDKGKNGVIQITLKK